MSSGTHIHVIDGKQYTYPNNACSICNPPTTTTYGTPSQPTAYTKGNTVILKFSKASMCNVTYWAKNKVFIMSMKQIVKDSGGKLMRSGDGKPIWNAITRRVPPEVLKSFVYELSVLLKNTGSDTNAPKRD